VGVAEVRPDSATSSAWSNWILLPHPHDVRYITGSGAPRMNMNPGAMPRSRNFRSRATTALPDRGRTHLAIEQRGELFGDGPLVVVAPCGSGKPKTWPHVQRFIDLMATRQVYPVVVGDLPAEASGDEPVYGDHGRDLQIRQAMALAQVADVVVGTETALLNASSRDEPMLKVVLLSHSSPENLTKHWTNTMSVQPEAIACYPCHGCTSVSSSASRTRSGLCGVQGGHRRRSGGRGRGAPSLDELQRVREAA